jgi:hypothetical protein
MSPQELLIYEKELHVRLLNVPEHEVLDEMHDALDEDRRAGKISDEEAEVILSRAAILLHPGDQPWKK